MNTYWTKEEDNLLQKLWPVATKEEILSKITRNWQGCLCRASKLKIKRDKKWWNDQEENILKNHYKTLDQQQLLDLLPNRTWNAIIQKAEYIGLKRFNVDANITGKYYCGHCDQFKTKEEFRNVIGESNKSYTCIDCFNKKERDRYAKNREKEHIRNRNKHKDLKVKVLQYYGLKCACCGEVEIDFLCLDHINNDGSSHRKAIGTKAGNGFYYWIKKNNFPDGFQTLCMNCNWSKRIHGKCIHQIKNEQEKNSNS